ncbi:ectonucleotide pyrophosphatase/phosphodiesterase family member 5 [Aplysia californica]|uniref:Ectonucleotide pyrophosphatase/phosphodiesterase family member 5 n=1 Tax=Aplysia californica TaxID=6500 RepID=A0ABM0JWK0_APLCA|nr:ectonucleotide pyrophosphatase/phosphodiesterase family member 5 [Aplysia californica]
MTMIILWSAIRQLVKTVLVLLSLDLLLIFHHSPSHIGVEAHGGGEETVPPLLLISFDGFKWDYIERANANLKSFERFKSEGVYARNGLKNVFVTSTLPNHWTLVTGLFPENHGILNNHFKDPKIEKKFVPKYKDPYYRNDPAYYDDGGEPIWVTNELQSKHGRSGTVMWFGAENPVKSYRPSLHMPYDDKVSFEKRIDTIVDWFTLPHHPINLGLVYFQEPDSTAHKAGPESENVTRMISRINDIIDHLFTRLEEKDILDDINIIITSDHGFTNVSRQKLIELDAIVEPTLYELVTESPVASIYPHEGQFDNVFEKLNDAATRPDSHFTVYKKDTIPERYHYKHNARVPPIVAVADLHYSFIANKTADEFIIKGDHGYDNEFQEMHPFFMAMGPSFKAGVSVETFPIVDVYPLLCHLLHLHPASNNGSLSTVAQFLHDEHENSMWTFGTYILVLIVIASVGGVFSVAACRQHRYLKRKISQLRLSPLQTTIKYSIPPKGDAKTRLLSDDDDDDFDDANDDEDDHILEIVSKR